MESISEFNANEAARTRSYQTAPFLADTPYFYGGTGSTPPLIAQGGRNQPHIDDPRFYGPMLTTRNLLLDRLQGDMRAAQNPQYNTQALSTLIRSFGKNQLGTSGMQRRMTDQQIGGANRSELLRSLMQRGSLSQMLSRQFLFPFQAMGQMANTRAIREIYEKQKKAKKNAFIKGLMSGLTPDQFKGLNENITTASGL